MGMYRGVFNVIKTDGVGKTTIDSSTSNNTVQVQQAAATIPAQGGSCGGGGGGCGCGAKPQRQAALNADKTPPVSATTQGSVQIINATYSPSEDIKPNKFTVKAGSPVKFDIDAKEDGQGCMGSIMIPGLDDNPQGFEKGKVTSLSFTPAKPGSYTITCAMRVPRGTIIVE